MKAFRTNYYIFAMIVFFIAILFSSIYSLPNVFAASSPITQGDGSAENPYVIDSSAKLEYMAEQINAGSANYSTAYYKQTCDISLSGITWTPINSFGGNYDGQGYLISDLYGTSNDFGFISTITSTGVFKNVGFTNINLNYGSSAKRNIGIIALYNNGTISNCFSQGSIIAKNSSTNDTLYLGGLVCYQQAGTITNCYNAINMSVSTSAGLVCWKNVGGLIGELTGGTVSNCYNIGKVEITGGSLYWRAGGIAGRCEGEGTVNNCASLENSVYIKDDVKNDLIDCYWTVSVSISGSNNAVVSASTLKSQTSAPLSSWEWNTSNNTPRTWGFVSDSSSSLYNSGYPQLRVFYENFVINFYNEDGTSLLSTKTTRYPEYAVSFSELTAPAKKGHTFNGYWTTQTNGGGNKHTGTLNNIYSNVNLYATYDVNYYNLKITTSNGLAGTVSTREESVAYNTSITASVSAVNAGYLFLEWRNLDDNSTISTSSNYTFNMPDYDYSIYAYFAQETYSVKIVINNTEFGTVSGQGDYYTVGQNVEIVATPNKAYKVDKIYLKDGTTLSTANTYSFAMPRENQIIYVDFVLAKYTLTVLSYPDSTAQTVGTGEYYAGENVNLSFSNVASGYKFAFWKIGDANKAVADFADAQLNFEMPAEDTNIYCCFVDENLNVVCFVGQDNRVIASHVVESGTNITPPTENVEIEKYIFSGWFDAKSGGTEIVDFNNITTSFNAYAVYERIFDCNLSINIEIVNENEFVSDLKTMVFLTLKTPDVENYTFALNKNMARQFKLASYGQYTLNYVLPTYYIAKVYLNNTQIEQSAFSIADTDENIEIKFIVEKNKDELMFDASEHFNNISNTTTSITPNTKIDGEDIYNGVNSALKGQEFDALDTTLIPTSPYGYEIKDILGAVNWGGLYNFSNLNYLVEGAKFVGQDMGSTVYKCSFANHYQSMYPFNEDWGTGSINTMLDLAKTPAYTQLFNLPEIQTYILVAYEFVYCPWERVITNGYTMEMMEIYYEQVRNEFADLTEYLLNTYSAENKIFILSNWEGDNAYGAYFDMCTTDAERQLLTDAYVGYINARQDGIIAGRNRASGTTSKVYGNFEVCHIGQDIPYVPNRWRLVDVAVPKTYCDLYSFSDWYTYLKDTNGNYTFPLEDILDTLYNAVQNNLCNTDPENYYLNPDFAGKKNVMVTEFGYDENTDSEFDEKIRTEVEKAINWGVYKLTYWGVYSNVRLVAGTERPKNEELQGLWLIRPDGTFTEAFWYMKSIISGVDYLSTIPKIVFEVEEAVGVNFVANSSNIIFKDDLIDTSNMKGHSLTTNEDANGRITFTQIDPSSSNYQYFEEFNGYFGSVDTTGIIQTKNDKEMTFISYEMHSNRFGILLYNYNDYFNYVYLDLSKLEEFMIVEGKTKEGEWEKISIKAEQTSAQNRDNSVWFQTYLSATVEVDKYDEMRIVFANKEYNEWDPIITSVFFFKGGQA